MFGSVGSDGAKKTDGSLTDLQRSPQPSSVSSGQHAGRKIKKNPIASPIMLASPSAEAQKEVDSIKERNVVVVGAQSVKVEELVNTLSTELKYISKLTAIKPKSYDKLIRILNKVTGSISQQEDKQSGQSVVELKQRLDELFTSFYKDDIPEKLASAKAAFDLAAKKHLGAIKTKDAERTAPKPIAKAYSGK